MAGLSLDCFSLLFRLTIAGKQQKLQSESLSERFEQLNTEQKFTIVKWAENWSTELMNTVSFEDEGITWHDVTSEMGLYLKMGHSKARCKMNTTDKFRT